MDFFDTFPEPAPPPERPPAPPRPKWMMPDAALPAEMAENAIIVREEGLAIAIGGLSVYPNGFDFSLHIRSRSDGDQIDPYGHRRRRDYLRNTVRPDPGDPEQNLRVGVQFADGRRAASNQSLRPLTPDQDVDPDEVVLLGGHGGGGGRAYDLTYWIHPLPPEGPVTIVISWLAQGITEVRHDFDGAAILAAAEKAVQLWDDEPPRGWVGSPQ
ncbi:hypothetical protein [Catenulispora rubra]|uniref:hypothetical protein n=1 Tax=Catenulispora rubra TaxID=280293 RepID=UPI0018926150|nr:hypothetical protein [Catenulispora rubra]